MSNEQIKIINFEDFGLAEPVLKSVKELGYESPSPIQAEAIPIILQGRDLVGQAQTGTGKTAAFALPLPFKNKPKSQKSASVGVSANSRISNSGCRGLSRICIQFEEFSHSTNLWWSELYRTASAIKARCSSSGGYAGACNGHHMRRGTLKLGNIATLVLDEADEMLRMGFIYDVEWILEQIP